MAESHEAPPRTSAALPQQPLVLQERPFWLSVVRYVAWLAMLALVLAFAARGGGGAFIYQNF